MGVPGKTQKAKSARPKRPSPTPKSIHTQSSAQNKNAVVASSSSSSSQRPAPRSTRRGYGSSDDDDDMSGMPIRRLRLNDDEDDEDDGNDGNEQEDGDNAEEGAEAAAEGAPATDGTVVSRKKKPVERQPGIRFLDLPSELRIKIYSLHFSSVEPVVDLSPDNWKNAWRKLALLRTCRRIYQEASHFFYSTHVFRIFPTHPGRFFKTRRPLLMRLSSRQRASMTKLELRFGPGFNKPPKCWVVTPKLGLADCVHVRTISVFVQLDPSLSWLDGFRKQGFYESFSCNLLDDVLKKTPSVDVVEFDGYESVRKDCPIMEGLLDVARKHSKRITWGPRNGWTDADPDPAKVVRQQHMPTPGLIITRGEPGPEIFVTA